MKTSNGADWNDSAFRGGVITIFNCLSEGLQSQTEVVSGKQVKVAVLRTI
jgi:hypothetical protein